MGSYHGYFSQTVIPTGPNKINKPTQDMTKEELVNRFEQLLASRGTYTVSGKKLVRKDISHSDPNLEGHEQIQEYRIEGDILTLTMPASNAEARFQRLK